MTVQTTQTPRGYTPGNLAQAQDAAVFERSGSGVYLTIEWITAYIQAVLGGGVAITFGSTAPANTTGKQDDVFFNIATGEVLRKGALTWSVQANFALDTEVTAAITAAITGHTGAADPHPIYLTQAEATALYKPLTTDDAAGSGLRLTLLTSTTGTPANGQIIANNSFLSSITQLLISETDRNGAAIANIEDLLADTLRIQIQNEQSEDIYCYFRVNGTPTDIGTYRSVPVAFVSKPTAITTLTQLAGTGEVSIGLFGGAAAAAAAVSSGSPGIRLVYNTTQGLVPNLGEFSVNNTVITNANILAITVAESQLSLVPLSNILERLKVGAICRISKDITNFFEFTVTSDFILEPITQFDFRGSIGSVKLLGSIANGNVCFLTIVSDAPSSGGLSYSTQSADANIAEGQGFITSGSTNLSFTAPAGTVAGQPLGVFRNSVALWSLLMPSGATIFGSGSNSSAIGIRSLSAEGKAYAICKALAPNVWRVLDSSGIEFIP